MKKRFLALAMSLLMTASVLAGCGGQNASGTTEAVSEQSTAGGESQAAESTAAQESAEAQNTAADDQELVELRLIFYGDMTARRDEFLRMNSMTRFWRI